VGGQLQYVCTVHGQILMCQVLLQVQIHISFELFKLHHVAIEKVLCTLSVLCVYKASILTMQFSFIAGITYKGNDNTKYHGSTVKSRKILKYFHTESNPEFWDTAWPLEDKL